VRLSRELIDEIVAHAREDAPNECCGMIAAEDGRAVEIYRATNAADSPLRYEIEPRDQFRIEMAIDEAGLALGAIYHSHTRSAPYPSQTDVNLAFHPHALYVIVGVAGPEPEVRAYRILDSAVHEVELTIES